MEYKQLKYDVMDAALTYGINTHPQIKMIELGYTVLGSIPQTLGDCWWFTVKDIIYPLPGYLTEMSYSFDYWHNKCHRNCEYFKENPCCCQGGNRCLKKRVKEEK